MNTLSKNQDTISEVIGCYGGKTWVKEIHELFPPSKFGCINFGYWEHVPDTISIEIREKSQLSLYNKLFDFAEINKTSISTVLEVGCGRGHGIHLLSINHDGYGIDLVASQIQKCIENYPNLRSKFKQGFSDNLEFLPNTFDFVISIEAAQHFHNFFAFAEESYRVLKKDGKIAITTFFFTNSDSQKEIKNFIPQDITGTHCAIPIHKAKEHLEQAGFENIKISSIGAYVFHGFCKWATQSMSQQNHSPKWVETYKKGLIDYYMIHAKKNPTLSNTF